MARGRGDRIGWLRSVAGRALAFAVLWWAASEGDIRSPPLAAIAIAAATAASLAVLPPVGGWRVRPLSIVRFAGYFVRESLRGGIDVARRALAPSLPIDPGVEEWRSERLDGRLLSLVAGCIGLLPGTLTTEVRDRTLLVHVLARELPWSRTVGGLERHAAAIRAESPSGFER